MKLNYDCFRDVLLYLEENLNSKPLKIRNIAYELEHKYPFDDVVYTFQKLTEFKFIKILTPTCTKHSLVKEITIEGHQVLDKIRPISTWQKIKKIANETGVSSLTAIFDIIKNVISNKL